MPAGQVPPRVNSVVAVVGKGNSYSFSRRLRGGDVKFISPQNVSSAVRPLPIALKANTNLKIERKKFISFFCSVKFELTQHNSWRRRWDILDILLDKALPENCSSAKLYQLLKNLLAPDIPSDQTLDKLKDALKKHLTPKPLIIPSRHKFLNRKQTEGEGRRFTFDNRSQTFDSYFWFKRGLPVLAATRLLHYALILQSFEFDIIFRKTIEHGNADFLSRLPKTSEELEVKDDITIFQMSQIEALPVTSKELRQETSKDIELGPLLRALREGKDLQGREAQYTIEDGCIMYGQRVCIRNFGRTFWKNYMLDT
ncbi:transposon Tf2-9 polyprotein [Trichonephila clavipes]|nr:transposon Tf2-9 polyprotein [Trichonephila clavipes]